MKRRERTREHHHKLQHETFFGQEKKPIPTLLGVMDLVLHGVASPNVVRLPAGTFSPYSDVKTALLFFQRPGPTKEVWYYELPLPEGLKKFSKGSPILDEHFAEARELWAAWGAFRQGKGERPEPTERSWIVTVEVTEDEEAKYLLREGDILFNRTNSAELVGKTAVYHTDRPAIFASYLIRIVADPSRQGWRPPWRATRSQPSRPREPRAVAPARSGRIGRCLASSRSVGTQLASTRHRAARPACTSRQASGSSGHWRGRGHRCLSGRGVAPSQACPASSRFSGDTARSGPRFLRNCWRWCWAGGGLSHFPLPPKHLGRMLSGLLIR